LSTFDLDLDLKLNYVFDSVICITISKRESKYFQIEVRISVI